MGFLKFIETKDTGKTKVFNICNNSGDILGYIKWFANWRRYCFYTIDNMIFDVNCISEVSDFITNLMEERKNDRKAN
jgi:hypothetical protein